MAAYSYEAWFATLALIIPSTSWQLFYQSYSISSHEINYGQQLLHNQCPTKYNCSDVMNKSRVILSFQYVNSNIVWMFELSLKVESWEFQLMNVLHCLVLINFRRSRLKVDRWRDSRVCKMYLHVIHICNLKLNAIVNRELNSDL